MIAKTVQDLRDAADQLESDRANFLRRRGWKYTSDNPGSIWLWSKKVEGVEWRVPEHTAIGFEEFWENVEADAQESGDGEPQ